MPLQEDPEEGGGGGGKFLFPSPNFAQIPFPSLIFGQIPVPAVKFKRNPSAWKIRTKTLYMCNECFFFLFFRKSFFGLPGPGVEGAGERGAFDVHLHNSNTV